MRGNAWAVRIRRGGDIEIFGGSRVERTDDMIAEGAWAGTFDSSGLRSAAFRCGSGVIFGRNEALLVAPSHSIEGVYCWVAPSEVWLANSAHLIIALVPGARPGSLEKARDASKTMMRGKLAYFREVYSTDQGRMMRFAFGRVVVSLSDLDIREQIDVTWSAKKLQSFANYKSEVSETLAALASNASDSRRAAPYTKIITTCSAGYDSAACAALAAQMGASEALSLRTARGGATDTGRPVAEALGLTCHEYSRLGEGVETKVAEDFFLSPEALDLEKCRDFLGSLNTAEDLFFSSFEQHLPNSIVLTGFHGDKVWAMGCPSGAEIVRGDASGSGLDEFRKRVGFVNVPVPFIAADYAGDIAEISSSKEMKPWRVNYSYNRPIPRRIAEEAGVPRDVFGLKKSAGSILLRDSGEVRRLAFESVIADYRDMKKIALRPSPTKPSRRISAPLFGVFKRSIFGR